MKGNKNHLQLEMVISVIIIFNFLVYSGMSCLLEKDSWKWPFLTLSRKVLVLKTLQLYI